ncbi:unnamed protein product, partial [Arabidopsis halleri]
SHFHHFFSTVLLQITTIYITINYHNRSSTHLPQPPLNLQKKKICSSSTTTFNNLCFIITVCSIQPSTVLAVFFCHKKV